MRTYHSQSRLELKSLQFQSTGNWFLKNVDCSVQISRILRILEGGYVLSRYLVTVGVFSTSVLQPPSTNGQTLWGHIFTELFFEQNPSVKRSASAPTVAERSKYPRVAIKWSPKVEGENQLMTQVTTTGTKHET